jgi:hypothetical protein
MTLSKKQYRQGDVLLVPIEDVPRGMRSVPLEHGRLVLAHGEVTGHAHAISAGRAELIGRTEDREKLVTAEQAVELYLLVHGDEPVQLVHEEHATIDVDPGRYRIVRQREYAPEANRLVAD